jgi:hypothetical protein
VGFLCGTTTERTKIITDDKNKKRKETLQ